MSFSSKKLLFYILAFLIFTPIFYSLGLFFGTKLLPDKELKVPLTRPPQINNTSTYQEKKVATFSGIVRAQIIQDPTRGTHQLEEDDGRLIVFLKSDRIDLSFVEGSWVIVEGVVEKLPDLKIDLVKVEKIRFK